MELWTCTILMEAGVFIRMKSQQGILLTLGGIYGMLVINWIGKDWAGEDTL